jgi:glutathione S-transferase
LNFWSAPDSSAPHGALDRAVWTADLAIDPDEVIRTSAERLLMALKLYFHPLSSFCQKALIALYENDTPFEPHIVDLTDEIQSAEFRKIWPIGKFPVLRDDDKDRTIPESTIIIEYLSQHYPGKTQLVPADADLARQTRFRDRFYDLHIQDPMQKVVGDRLRPPTSKDPFGVEQAKERMRTAYGMIDQEMATRTWAMGSAFSIQHGRLRRRTGAVLREPGDAVWRQPQECGALL